MLIVFCTQVKIIQYMKYSSSVLREMESLTKNCCFVIAKILLKYYFSNIVTSKRLFLELLVCVCNFSYVLVTGMIAVLIPFLLILSKILVLFRHYNAYLKIYSKFSKIE